MGRQSILHYKVLFLNRTLPVPLIGTDYPRCSESTANVAPPTLPQFSLISRAHTSMRIISQIYDTDVFRRILGECSPGRVQKISIGGPVVAISTSAR
jgi:hypothetical protein